MRQPGWDRELVALRHHCHPCPSSAAFSHTMEQSAWASPAATAHGPAEGFCTPLLFIQKKPEQRNHLGVTLRLRLQVRED